VCNTSIVAAPELGTPDDSFQLREATTQVAIMSNKKDMRRPDLSKPLKLPIACSIANTLTVIPYQVPPPKEATSDISGTLGSTLPMAAMFTRNKFMGWYGMLNIVWE
jgi:hypothetical protein